MPMIPFPGNNMNNICQKDVKNENINNEFKEVNKENENNEKIMPQVFVRAPIFFNQINKQKNLYNKYHNTNNNAQKVKYISKLKDNKKK